MGYCKTMIEFKGDSEAREALIEMLNATALVGSLVLATIVIFLL